MFTRRWWVIPRRFGAYCVGSGLVLQLCRSSQWRQRWRRADATAAMFATTGVEPVLPLWASLSASAMGWYYRRGVVYSVVVLVQRLWGLLRMRHSCGCGFAT